MNMHARSGHEDHAHPRAPHHPQPPAGSAALKDPVCGMTVTEQSPHHVEHEGRPYYFCSAKCQAKFSAEPPKYLQPAEPLAAPRRGHCRAAAGTIYTCPMHPEIRQDHPGNCPKCGMTLEPVLPDAGGRREPGTASTSSAASGGRCR